MRDVLQGLKRGKAAARTACWPEAQECRQQGLWGNGEPLPDNLEAHFQSWRCDGPELTPTFSKLCQTPLPDCPAGVVEAYINLLVRWETPRLCRGGNQSLTDPACLGGETIMMHTLESDEARRGRTVLALGIQQASPNVGAGNTLVVLPSAPVHLAPAFPPWFCGMR